VQYKDYSEGQKKTRQKERLKRQEEYWLRRYEGKIPLPAMPTDYPRPRFRSYTGAQLTFRLENPLAAKMKQLIAGSGITLYMLLLAVHNILLSRYTGQEDVIVGSGTAGRNHADLEKVMGMFVNILAMRNHPDGNLTFSEFLEKVKQSALEAFKNQDYPFEELIRKLNLYGNPSASPLFDTVSQSADIPLPDLEIPGLKLKPYSLKSEVTRFDLIIDGRETAEGDAVEMRISYASELFKPTTVQEIARNYREILEQVVENRNIRLKDIRITTGLLEANTGVFKEHPHEFGF
jgi:non-ribosomal peptide synthetase component F